MTFFLVFLSVITVNITVASHEPTHLMFHRNGTWMTTFKFGIEFPAKNYTNVKFPESSSAYTKKKNLHAFLFFPPVTVLHR